MIIEEPTRLSESLLWKLQAKAYGDLGPAAWMGGPVPLYITSNPYIAKQYAQLVFAFWRDLDSQGLFYEEQPFYILELGSGIGRFGYQFLVEWERLTRDLPELWSQTRYILSDNVASNRDYWKTHKGLQRFLDEGVLELAIFDVEQDDEVTLWPSEAILRAENLAHPLVAMANYLFDTIAQDRFRIRAGQLEEGLVSLSVDRDIVEDPLDPSLIDDLVCQYSYRPIDAAGYYPKDSLLHRVLQNYAKTLDAATFVLPTAGFNCLQRVQQLSGDRLFLVAGDQGVAHQDQLTTWDDLTISQHGTFSHPVNYHALGEYFKLQGGEAFLSRDRGVDFVVVAGSIGVGNLMGTSACFEATLNHFEPQDYWKLSNFIEDEVQKPSLGLICRVMKLGNADPAILHYHYDRIRETLGDATVADRQRFVELCLQAGERFFPMQPQEGAFFFSLGMLCFEVQRHEAAAKLFAKALVYVDDLAAAWFYLGVSHRFLGRAQDAGECLAKAKALDPRFSLPS